MKYKASVTFTCEWNSDSFGDIGKSLIEFFMKYKGHVDLRSGGDMSIVSFVFLDRLGKIVQKKYISGARAGAVLLGNFTNMMILLGIIFMRPSVHFMGTQLFSLTISLSIFRNAPRPGP